MLPSDFDEIKDCPALCALLKRQMDMQVQDLRVLLELPTSELPAGCNFAAASVLFNLMSGISVCFFSPQVGRSVPRAGRGDAFKRLLRTHYPWEDEPLKPSKAVEVLYHWARNPLAHSLGIDDSDRPELALGKGPLTMARVLELETTSTRPEWLLPTVYPIELKSGAEQLVISVPTLYWGLHRLLHSLFSSPDGHARAEEFARSVRLAERDPARSYFES
jgi:hypothetical protein